ncbi:IclR family transcriptional regulator [Rhodanobacter sp. Col0626]|uniref:IclR family transcriptional regulator n=1 Tax=Rhodanobacter sp. Col0626 TaxID=3415679 RepID=UPI003CEBDB03
MDTTLLKGLGVLEALAASRSARGVTELAQSLELTKSNVHRTLQTLTAAGYVRSGKVPGTYECTLKLFEIASGVVARIDVRQSADVFMQQLARLTKETIHLSVLDGMDVIYLNKIESPHPVRAYSTIGGRAPAHCVASGKALLAWQSDACLQQLASRLAAPTNRSIASRDALFDELAKIRRQGFAVNRGEWRDGVGGIASIVFDLAGAPVAAIGISGPLERLRPAAIRKYSQLVVDAACGLSRSLGYSQVSYPPVVVA